MLALPLDAAQGITTATLMVIEAGNEK